MRKLSVLSVLLVAIAQQTTAATIDDKLHKAKETIDSYQNLRDACAEARNKKRQDCLSQLSTASEDYREAKLLLLANSSSARLAANRP